MYNELCESLPEIPVPAIEETPKKKFSAVLLRYSTVVVGTVAGLVLAYGVISQLRKGREYDYTTDENDENDED
jgi:hypothetical protein